MPGSENGFVDVGDCRPPLGPHAKACEEEKKVPFTTDQPMQGDPQRQWADFCTPRLRACPLPRDTIVWEHKLGQGYDGGVWKVSIEGNPYVVKVFWDDIAPPSYAYWAPQKECHNAALLDMIKASINAADEPIYLMPEPRTQRDALANLFAFSEEGRCKDLFAKLPERASISSVPRIRDCFGWMKVHGQELYSLRPELRPGCFTMNRRQRSISRSKCYYAIVYEYIPQTVPALDDNSTQAVLDFFRVTGFCLRDLRSENWIGGILLDMADLACPFSVGWSPVSYKRIDVKSCPEGFFQGQPVDEQSGSCTKQTKISDKT